MINRLVQPDLTNILEIIVLADAKTTHAYLIDPSFYQFYYVIVGPSFKYRPLSLLFLGRKKVKKCVLKIKAQYLSRIEKFRNVN